MANNKSHFIPDQIKWFIIEEKRKNTTSKKVVDLVFNQFQRKITFKTISRLWTKYKQTGTVADRHRSGRPRTFSEREERNIVRDFLAHPGLSIKHAVRERKKDQKPGSRRTFRRVLRGRVLVPKVSEQGKEIISRNKKERVKFAKSHIHWNVREWSRVVFSDEVTLYPERTQTCVRWSRAGEASSPPEENNLRRISINIWGFIRYDGKRGLVRFPETMRKKEYRELLEGNLFDAIEDPDDADEQLIWMQDGASYHSCSYVTDWLIENNVDFLNWPAQSPDLNPIENVWAAVRNELFNRRGKIKNTNDLWAQTREIFYNLTLVSIRNLYESIPQRLDSVIKLKGNRTSY